MHGGTNKGAPRRNRNAWKHGDRSEEAELQLRTIRDRDRDLRLMSKLRAGDKLRSDELDWLMQLLRERDDPEGRTCNLAEETPAAGVSPFQSGSDLALSNVHDGTYQKIGR